MMNRKRIQGKTAAVLLLVAACLFCMTGCSEKKSEAASEPPKETVVHKETDTSTITVGSIQCDSQAQELTVTDASAAELEEILPQLPELKKLTLEGCTDQTSVPVSGHHV